MNSEAVRILLFEDTPEHQELFLTYLNMTVFSYAEVTVTPLMQAGERLLKSADFDIVFLDLALNDSTATESIKRIKMLSLYAPIVVLTSLDDRETIMNIINMGAQDCLPKSELSDLVLERTIRFNLDRWRLSKQLIQSEEKVRNYSQALEQSGEAIMITDVAGNVIHVNRAFTEITGYPEEEVIGQNLSILKSGEQDCDFYKMMWAKLNDGLVWHGKIIDKKKDGELYPAMLTISPIKDEAGKISSYIGVQQNLEQYELLEQKFYQVEKMKSIGMLAAGMAHELNNPLGGMLQGLQNVRRRLSPVLKKNQKVAKALGLDLEKVHEYLQRREIEHFMDGIAEAGQRASDIVKNTLNFSRKTKLEVGMADMAELIDRVVELASVDYDLQQGFDFRAIKIQREYEVGLLPVPCVASELQQVLFNLLRNAAQALYEQEDSVEGPQIIVRARQEGKLICIEVEDNGPGMDEVTRQRVFEPFYTTRSPGKGTGLGLSVSYFIVHDELGGSIDVESEPGKGTKFIMSLPMRTAVSVETTESQR